MEEEQQRCPVTHCSAGWSMVLCVPRSNAWRTQGYASKVPRVVSLAGSANKANASGEHERAHRATVIRVY